LTQALSPESVRFDVREPERAGSPAPEVLRPDGGALFG